MNVIYFYYNKLDNFSGGLVKSINQDHLKMNNYIISSNEDLLILVSHLENYPLLTQKG